MKSSWCSDGISKLNKASKVKNKRQKCYTGCLCTRFLFCLWLKLSCWNKQGLPWRCCLDSTICCIKHCVCLVTHLGHLHRCASFLYHVHYCTHWILLDFALCSENKQRILSPLQPRGSWHLSFSFFSNSLQSWSREGSCGFCILENVLFSCLPLILVFLPKKIQNYLILVKYNVSYNVPWCFKMSIYVTKRIKISQLSILYVALFSVKIWVFNDLSMIAFCIYLHFAQALQSCTPLKLSF